MIKLKYHFLIAVVFLGVVFSCKKDDDPLPPPTPPRDRGEEAIRAQAEIEEFLETHFYNYEEYQADPDNFKIRFDTIAGDNANKIPLKDQVTFKMVQDVVDESVTYKLYYLVVRQGGGEKPNFSDITTNTYDGRLLNLELFDSSVVPVQFNLVDNGSSPGIIRGLQQAIIEFNVATEIISNPDGSITAENFGIGAVFIPSGLGYFQYPPSGNLDPYDQLIFSFELLATKETDYDDDGIPSHMEDLNGNGYLMDDDTDGNGVPNYLDNDDDGDGRLTKYEIEIIDGEITFPDTNGNGIPDYLDPSI